MKPKVAETLNEVALGLPITEEEAEQNRSDTVVRLRRSYWHDDHGAYLRLELKYLKKKCCGHNILDHDCDMVGADEVIPKIINLDECEDGIYYLETTNGVTDYWTGTIEDWDYVLIPYKEDQNKS